MSRRDKLSIKPTEQVKSLTESIKKKLAQGEIRHCDPRILEDHPLQSTIKPQADKKYNELKTAIEMVDQIISPLWVRKLDNKRLEIIAGHTRKAIAVELDMSSVPYILIDCSDVEADFLWNVSNSQREFTEDEKRQRVIHQLECIEAMKKDPNAIQLPKKETSNKAIAKQNDVSERTVVNIKKAQRELLPELYELFKDNTLGTTIATELCGLSPEVQKNLHIILGDNISNMSKNAIKELQDQYTKDAEKLSKELQAKANKVQKLTNEETILKGKIKELEDANQQSEEAKKEKVDLIIELSNKLEMVTKDMKESQDYKSMEEQLQRARKEKREKDEEINALRKQIEVKNKFKLIPLETINTFEEAFQKCSTCEDYYNAFKAFKNSYRTADEIG